MSAADHQGIYITQQPAMSLIMRRAARPVINLRPSRNSASIISRSISSMVNQSIPVVLIGRTGEVGKMVTEALKPEYEGQSYTIQYLDSRVNKTPSDSQQSCTFFPQPRQHPQSFPFS